MRNPCSFFATAILLLSFHAVSPAETSSPDLDAIAKQAVAQSHVVGASVLVARGDQILFLKGYGAADIGLEAPSQPNSVYHIVGPMLPFTGVAVMQQVERGKLSLDDDIAKYLPEFPTQDITLPSASSSPIPPASPTITTAATRSNQPTANPKPWTRSSHSSPT